MRKKNFFLLLFIMIASFALIAINYYTIRIPSAIRAYVTGESQYSKGQKDALIYLYTYVETGDTAYMTLFNESLEIPRGDNLAKNNLLQRKSSDKQTTIYFMQGKNDPHDIPKMIWLFKTFKSTIMKIPIRLWGEAEPLIDQLYVIGNDLDKKIRTSSLTPTEKLAAVKKISFISGQLYRKESEFSDVLGATARKVNGYLFLANFLLVFIIISNISLYAIFMLKRFSITNKKLKSINHEIIETNKELDTLVYSVSHDLRAPITSIQGLLYLLKDETDKDRIKEYMDLVEMTIKKQDIFIVEIIDFFKNKRSSLSFHKFSMKKLIDDVLANNKFTPLARHIDICQEIRQDVICTDELRVKMIINNLISNAIKYSDEKKQTRTIAIKTEKINNEIAIEVIDNGIGIDKKHIDKIYNMFFVTSNANKGTGLGLYILKQNVEKLKGRVTVQSELNIGTAFTVYIPLIK